MTQDKIFGIFLSIEFDISDVRAVSASKIAS